MHNIALRTSLRVIICILNHVKPSVVCLCLQIVFPERVGALRRFLSAISPAFNVTLFHYRNTGNRESNVLLGLQIPPWQETAFAQSTEKLSDEFTFTELGGEARKVFDMFIQ
jgi:threonine dehydratase